MQPRGKFSVIDDGLVDGYRSMDEYQALYGYGLMLEFACMKGWLRKEGRCMFEHGKHSLYERRETGLYGMAHFVALTVMRWR